MFQLTTAHLKSKKGLFGGHSTIPITAAFHSPTRISPFRDVTTRMLLVRTSVSETISVGFSWKFCPKHPSDFVTVAVAVTIILAFQWIPTWWGVSTFRVSVSVCIIYTFLLQTLWYWRANVRGKDLFRFLSSPPPPHPKMRSIVLFEILWIILTIQFLRHTKIDSTRTRLLVFEQFHVCCCALFPFSFYCD